ncbi:OCIA domain-containing protein 1 [Collichthys lucidus]|uniref:OCIA domain-containing protein 1 n=1 Tax=Collichthys lucidus TaxID=240159 RepID=A0A4V6AMC2_COLLU|nr:OCIA domain-containing protein 1 [Collichthys lucidus]
MSSSNAGFTEERQRRGAQQIPVGMEYIPTEEERKVFKECNHESFWYRSVPFSVLSMALTQALVTRVAGFCGYLAGKMSYMRTCQEKFKRLENSPLGEALRQRTGLPQQYSKAAPSEMSDPDKPSFDSMFHSAEAPSQRDYSTEPTAYLDRSDDFSAPAESYVDEEEPRRKAILYEDLRLKNRENYEVTLTQKAETLVKSSPEKEPRRPKKETKNVYGDTWEE